MLFTREMVYPHVNYWKKGPHHHNNNTGPTFLNLKKGTARVPYKVLGGRWKPTTPFWLDNRSDMTVISPVVAGADWSADLVRFRLIILISRRWSQERESEREREREKKSRSQTRTVEFGVDRRFYTNRRPLAEGRMLENKRERLKTFLRKIDEKAIVRIKHFMKERWAEWMWLAEPLSAGEQHQQGGC